MSRTAPYRQEKCSGCSRTIRVRSDGTFAPHKVAARLRQEAARPCPKSGKPSGLSDRREFSAAVREAAITRGRR